MRVSYDKLWKMLIDKNITKGEEYQAEPFPEFIKEIIDAGGLLKSLKK
jgi:3-isopropylmalate/(R)-2-methylmalate dehydratase small subunit